MRKEVTVAVVFHSNYGHTAKQARAVADGVDSVAHARSVVIDIASSEPVWPKLIHVEAAIFGSPTYMGGVSARFKEFMEESSRYVMSSGFLWKDKIAAGFTNSGAQAGDKLATLIQIALFAAQHGMHWVNLGLPPANNSSKGTGTELNRLGFWLGASAQSNVDQNAELAPPAADLETARYLGKRVARVALALAAGTERER